MNGLLVVDKAAGMTSHDVVNVVRRATGERSVGHLGTLDPMATGVLPLLLGRFTRLAQYFGDAEKSYAGTIRFGWATDSFDADGERVGEAVPLTLGFEELATLASRFHGEMDQVPPVFSAKKINGVPAYKLARAGKEAPVKAARITIHRFVLTGLDGETAGFEMSVSAGGYVRSVAQELGRMVGCGAHLATLRRTAAGAFGLDQAVTVKELKSLSPDELERRMVHPRRMLPEMPSVTVDAATAGKLRNGMQANVAEFSQAPLVKVFAGSSDLMAVAKRIAGTLVQPVAVIG